VVLLEVNDLTLWYESVVGDVRALYRCAVSIEKASITGMLGKNGAGKTSLFKTLSGVIEDADGHITEGAVFFNGENITGLSPSDIVDRGLSHAPQGRHIFHTLSVLDNLFLGAGPPGKRNRGGGPCIKAELDRMFHLFPVLKERRRQKAGTLSGGEQQMLSIARALMARPTMLLLDEPFLGLAPLVMDTISKALQQLKQEGLTILIAEQNAEAVLLLSDSVCIMDDGFVFGMAPAEQWPLNAVVRQLYFGDTS
jgi:branched-chain amino acid transport system ATP-binding protein